MAPRTGGGAGAGSDRSGAPVARWRVSGPTALRRRVGSLLAIYGGAAAVVGVAHALLH